MSKQELNEPIAVDTPPTFHEGEKEEYVVNVDTNNQTATASSNSFELNEKSGDDASNDKKKKKKKGGKKGGKEGDEEEEELGPRVSYFQLYRFATGFDWLCIL
ncbi:hypothetical protein DFQ26_001204, partial [Actinomortierella ambigua]